LYVCASERQTILPCLSTMKMAGQEMPFSTSSTPKARMLARLSSESSGKVTPSFFASSAEVGGGSTEIATSSAPRLRMASRFFCSSPSCPRQNGHQ
jgi:hypothetical protein